MRPAPPTRRARHARGQIVSPPSFQTQPTIVPNTPQASAAPAAAAAAGAAVGAAAGAATVGGGDGVGVVRNIQVVADKDQNTMLIVATPSEYSIIEQALKKLDVASRQVMIEVTIAEVKLTDELQLRRRLDVQGRRAVGTRQRRPVPERRVQPGGAAADHRRRARSLPG